MKKLSLDTGIQEYQINDNGILRFNPSDPNVYARFMETQGKIEELAKKHEEQAKELVSIEDNQTAAGEVIKILKSIDTQIKQHLKYVFGSENDFDKILEGVSLYAVADNGNLVILNLLNLLAPIIQEGCKVYADKKAQQAVEQAKLNRAQRRAKRSKE